MEVDNEVSGNGNSYTTEFRQYDPRLGRWKSLDPLMVRYPNMSPYVAFNNNPIFYIDPRGLEGDDPPKGRTKYESGTTGGGSWCTNCGKNQTDRKTRMTEAIGGFILHIPDRANSKQVGNYWTGYSMEPTEVGIQDWDNNGYIGNSKTGVVYEGAEEGQVYSFTGADGDKYTARFDSDGGFDYYYSGDKKYINKRISDRDILSTKLGHALTYFSEAATIGGDDVPVAPTVNHYENIYASSFKLDDEQFDGTIKFHVATSGNSIIKGKRAANAIEFTQKDGTVAGTEQSGFKFVVYSYNGTPGTFHRFEKLISITFSDFNEYKRFVRYIHDNYNITDDNGSYVPDNSILPSEILKKIIMKKTIFLSVILLLASCGAGDVKRKVFHPNLNTINSDIINDTGLDLLNYKSTAEKKISNINYKNILRLSMVDLSNETLGSVFKEVKKVNGDTIFHEEIDSIMLQVARHFREGIKPEKSELVNEYFLDRIVYNSKQADTIYRHNTGEFDEFIFELSNNKEISDDEMGYLLVTNHILSMLYSERYKDWVPLGKG